MSSTHRKKIARALADATGLTYQDALRLVIAADDAGTLPHRLDAAGIDRAVRMLAADLAEPSPAPADTDDTRLDEACSRPGLVLVAGNSGSGKSVAITGILRDLLRGPNTIATIEDPVERYLSPGDGDLGVITQVDRSRIYEPFSEIFRDTLRTSPHVLFIDEISDDVRADAVLLAADTGHLTLSAIHAHDPARAVQNFLQWGVNPDRLARTLNAIVVTNFDGDQFFRTTHLITDEMRALIRKNYGSGSFLADLGAMFEPSAVVDTAREWTPSDVETTRVGLRRVAALLRSGARLHEALDAVSQSMSGEPQAVFQRLSVSTANGTLLSEALRSETHAFEPWAVKVFNLREAGTTMAEGFDAVANAL